VRRDGTKTEEKPIGEMKKRLENKFKIRERSSSFIEI